MLQSIDMDTMFDYLKLREVLPIDEISFFLKKKKIFYTPVTK